MAAFTTTRTSPSEPWQALKNELVGAHYLIVASPSREASASTAPQLARGLDVRSFRPEDEEIGGRKCKKLPAAQKAGRAMALERGLVLRSDGDAWSPFCAARFRQIRNLQIS